MKRKAVGIFVILAMVMLFGCTKNLYMTPVSEMTPKQKSLVAISVYNRMAESYRTRVALPDLSPAEKTVLRTEYATLVKAWPVIKAYDDFVKGVTPSIDAAIIEQLNQFLITYRY
jgi:hypothetical protein